MSTKNSILGISVTSPAVVGNKITAIFDFLNKRGLSTINLLLGDSLYRYTAMIKHQCNEQEGLKIAMEQNHALIKYYVEHIMHNKINYQLNFILTSDFEKEHEFHDIYGNLWQLFETYDEFRISVLNFKKIYFNRTFLPISESPFQDEFNEYTIKYLITELAIFAMLNKRGYNILIYPGSIQTISDIITMDHPYLSTLFDKYVFVSLRIKRN